MKRRAARAVPPRQRGAGRRGRGLGAGAGERRQPRPLAGDHARAARAGSAGQGRRLRAQLRPPDRDHRGDGLRPGRRGRDHRRRPAGSAGGDPGDAGQVARGLRGGLRDPRGAQGRDLVQGVHRQGVLPHHLQDHRHQHPHGHRRLPADGSQGGGGAEDDAREAPLHARHVGVGGLQADRASSTCGPSATRARPSTR